MQPTYGPTYGPPYAPCMPYLHKCKKYEFILEYVGQKMTRKNEVKK